MANENKRATLYNKLKQYVTEVENHSKTPLNVHEVTVIGEQAEGIVLKLEKVQDELEATAVDKDALQTQFEAGMRWDKTYRDLKSKLRALKEMLTPAPTSTTTSTTTSSSASVKLPTISLPTFDGSFDQWSSFKDLFTSAVANNKELSGSQKLQYLKTTLRGEPLQLIDYLTTTDTNYPEAWKILTERYNNTREIRRTHVCNLLDYKSVRAESAKELQALLDNAEKCIRSLKLLGCKTDEWDDLTVVIIEKKLDAATRREWARKQTGTTPPTFKEMSEFLTSHIRGLQAAGATSSAPVGDRRGEKQLKVNYTATDSGSCPNCAQSHPIHNCKELLSSDASGRSAMIKKARLCYNCLKSDHIIKSCPSPRRCKRCGSKHHTLLHEDRKGGTPQPAPSTSKEVVPTVQGHHITADDGGLLMTAMVLVPDSYGQKQRCRVFVDGGSEGDFISEACLKRLGLHRLSTKVRVKGVGDQEVGTSKGKVKTTLFSRHNGNLLEVELLVMRKITGLLPSIRRQHGRWPHLEGIPLADSEWHTPGEIDMLVGIKYYNKIMLYLRREGGDDAPVAWETIFGWGVAGVCPTDDQVGVRSFHITLHDPITEQLQKDDAKFHRILWRPTADQPVKEYQLNTITYGTACAPNLATRCLQQLGIDCKNEYPLASHVLLNDAFVDDVMSGQQTPEEAIQLYLQLMKAVQTAGLELRKWTSNSQQVLDAIPDDIKETRKLLFGEDELVKALGVQWNPAADEFRFKRIKFETTGSTTKRSLLSELAQVFDPLGLVSCVTLRGKLMMQELWRSTTSWDESVPDSIKERWDQYKEDLEYLPEIAIPRRIIPSGGNKTELHGFCDSSEIGFGGICYLRTLFPNGEVEVHFVTSKTKVAPLRQITLPRLELCAAVLLSELVVHVKECLKLDVDLYLWSDSTITLTWIAGTPRRWKTYVANRVAAIQELTLPGSWKHVAGIENPADLASRGCTAKDLSTSSLWWRGPEWLSQPNLPAFPMKPEEGDLEERALVVAVTTVQDESKILTRYSSLQRLKRITAWYIRYVLYRLKRKIEQAELSAVELQGAFSFWIRNVQHQHFKEELELLEKRKEVGRRSRLKGLHPYIDRYGIIRVSGRLQNAAWTVERKHQAILSGNSHLSYILVDHFHATTLHGGFQSTWSAVQSEFWMLRGRDKVRHFVRSCVKCRRYRSKIAEQLMGALPAPRISPSRPFTHTGVDYAGPFVLKDMVGRVPKTYKGYLCLFVCLATKAVYLEAASSLSTEAFIAAFRRFVSRNGYPSHMYSDCGTNFVGADRELKSFLEASETGVKIGNELSARGIQWHFNPPGAPHVGGLWEAAVKSTKHHLGRVTGSSPMTYEQFATLLSQVEAVLNSRPLSPRSADPGDLEPLTPGHFLVGGPLTAAPDHTLVDIPRNRLSQFQYIQQQLQVFWQRWSKEYLNTLQQRTKWLWDKENVKTGDLVLLIEETPPSTWRMGRIIEVNRGGDGRVRVVTVKTASSVVDRVIAKLVPLLAANE